MKVAQIYIDSLEALINAQNQRGPSQLLLGTGLTTYNRIEQVTLASAQFNWGWFRSAHSCFYPLGSFLSNSEHKLSEDFCRAVLVVCQD